MNNFQERLNIAIKKYKDQIISLKLDEDYTSIKDLGVLRSKYNQARTVVQELHRTRERVLDSAFIHYQKELSCICDDLQDFVKEVNPALMFDVEIDVDAHFHTVAFLFSTGLGITLSLNSIFRNKDNYSLINSSTFEDVKRKTHIVRQYATGGMTVSEYSQPKEIAFHSFSWLCTQMRLNSLLDSGLKKFASNYFSLETYAREAFGQMHQLNLGDFKNYIDSEEDDLWVRTTLTPGQKIVAETIRDNKYVIGVHIVKKISPKTITSTQNRRIKISSILEQRRLDVIKSAQNIIDLIKVGTIMERDVTKYVSSRRVQYHIRDIDFENETLNLDVYYHGKYERSEENFSLLDILVWFTDQKYNPVIKY